MNPFGQYLGQQVAPWQGPWWDTDPLPWNQILPPNPPRSTDYAWPDTAPIGGPGWDARGLPEPPPPQTFATPAWMIEQGYVPRGRMGVTNPWPWEQLWQWMQQPFPWEGR